MLTVLDSPGGLKLTRCVLLPPAPAELVVTYRSGTFDPDPGGFTDIIGAEAIPIPTDILLDPPENAPAPDV